MNANRLKNLRMNKQISQKEFAKQLGVSQQTIASWEVGRTEPANIYLKDIADYFNVSTDYLLGRDYFAQNTSLSNEQKRLLNDFEELNDENKKTILYLISQLNFAHDVSTKETKDYIVVTGKPVITVSP